MKIARELVFTPSQPRRSYQGDTNVKKEERRKKVKIEFSVCTFKRKRKTQETERKNKQKHIDSEKRSSTEIDF